MKILGMVLLGAFILYVICKVCESVFGIDLSWLTGDDPKKKDDNDKT
jgi:hypothetical protein